MEEDSFEIENKQIRDIKIFTFNYNRWLDSNEDIYKALKLQTTTHYALNGYIINYITYMLYFKRLL